MNRLLLLLPLTLTACTMAPRYERPAAPVAAEWQVATPAPTGAPIAWRQLFLDPRLQQTIDLALSNNRDLRIAALNIEQARARYGIARSGLLPGLDATGSGSQRGGDGQTESESYSADLGLSWELDLFGRIRSLKNAALEDFFASQANRDAVEISLISTVADAWLTLATDQDALELARQTYTARSEAYAISEGRARIGAISDLELAQQRTLLEQARGDVARLETTLDQDRSALTLLVGSTVPDTMLPDGLPQVAVGDMPVGLPSDVLLNRPDVMAAEHNLKAANADIGAARAAFFPSISLTGATGFASSDLGALFDAGSWSYGARLSLPIFSGGANRNGLRSAQAARDIAVAQYERAIQSAFDDVNQALAVRARIDERLNAQMAATEAAERAFTLSQARFDAGRDSYLTLLDAQRTWYSAQQSLITLRYLRSANLVALYRALGNNQSLR